MDDKNAINDPFQETLARLRARVAAAESSTSNTQVPATEKSTDKSTLLKSVAAKKSVATKNDFGKLKNNNSVFADTATTNDEIADIAARLRARSGSATTLSATDSTEQGRQNAVFSALNLIAVKQYSGEAEMENTHLTKLLAGLNSRQREAVAHMGGHLLVIAGAGSGKTRVLTTRISYLIASGEAEANEILAITFTNKAAKEMRERLNGMLGPIANRMWISTFHSACVRILRAEHEAIGYNSAFTIYDSADSQRLLKILCKEEGIDSKQYTPKILAYRISDLKNELISPAQALAKAVDRDETIVAEVYASYQRRLTTANAMDFDDLIFKTVRLLKENPEIREKYRHRFRQILVDEYQDTNPAQYELIRVLAGEKNDLTGGQLTVVGDADQSIYAFRGATIRNIENFENDFPNAHTVLLEQNYRSTQNILSAANAVIANNSGRRAKNLWTDSGKGEKLVGYVADSERDEASYVVEEINKLHDEGFKYGDFAIFYRANAQSRALEDMLMRTGTPYKVIGGTKFYDRKEIKDAIAYLQAVANPDDTISLRRIFNEPKRGLGAKAENAIAFYAQRRQISFGTALKIASGGADEVEGLSSRAVKSIQEFVEFLAEARKKSLNGEEPAEILDYLMDESGYLRVLQESNDPQDDVRVENIAELRSVAADFSAENPTGGLDDFLDQVSLVSDTDQIPDEENREGEVVLMTVHTAKGLEFPVVFVTGMEDGTFPHIRAMNSTQELSEERRLAYVALTRARKRLYITLAACRSQWGAPQELPASRFLEEIPEEVIEWRRLQPSGGAYGGGWGNSYQTSFTEKSWHNKNDSHYDWEENQDFEPAYGSGRNDFSKSKTFKAGKLGLAAETTSDSSQKTSTGAKLADSGFSARKNGDSENSQTIFKIGDKVRHKSFGIGKVVAIEGQGKSAVAKVRFNSGTTKRLMLRFAPLEKIF